MRASLLPCLVLLVAGAGMAAASKKKACHAADRAALVAINAAFGNPYHFASWTPDSPCCGWYDVDCDPFTGRVVGLAVFQDSNLTGTIPDAVAGLTHLRTLVFHHLPELSGTIPRSITKLTNLSRLTVSWTGVSGAVPSFLGALTALTDLDLSFNSLTGAIPASLAALPDLNGINLSRNRLTGAIPPLLFSKLAADQEAYLWLSHNNLSGSIPAEFAAVRFAHVELSRNQLTGSAAALFGTGKAKAELYYADLSRNVLEFDLSGVELPERLVMLDISHNAVYGGMPSVANLTQLQVFNVSYNRLCGGVPAGLASFDASSFQHNKCLCGAPLAPCK